MDQYAISSADLRTIELNLSALNTGIEVIDSNIEVIDSNVRTLYTDLNTLMADFVAYVRAQEERDRLQLAETRVVKYRQELEQKFGHFEQVRRQATGILQATDVGIVRGETIASGTEELMISAPGYWLAPCLVALSAWICNKPELADKAPREGIRGDDEKTSLLFALVCRRAGRKQACLKWASRYLATQDEQDLDRKSILILDAYASGLLGADTEGVLARQVAEWIEKLVEKPGFIESQTQQWSDAIAIHRIQYVNNSYTYLPQYCHEWPQLCSLMEWASLHSQMYQFFSDIFGQQPLTTSLKQQLDDILNSLVTDFDEAEIPLQKSIRMEDLVIKYGGDENRAAADMKEEETAFNEHRDFTQLLTDAALKPDVSHASVSMQKFAISLSRDWICDAYNDLTAKNRANVPPAVNFTIDGINLSTVDGSNEDAMVSSYSDCCDRSLQATLNKIVLTGSQKFGLVAGILFMVIGVVAAIFTFRSSMAFAIILGIVGLVVGLIMVSKYATAKKNQVVQRNAAIANNAKRKRNGCQIIRALVAEYADFRAEYAARDCESTKVIDLLDQLTPDQYVHNISGANRRIKV